MTAEKKAAE
jgi:hypothetical protein